MSIGENAFVMGIFLLSQKDGKEQGAGWGAAALRAVVV
jgi:hypothetical protein